MTIKAQTRAQRPRSHPSTLPSSDLDQRTLAACAAGLLIIDDARLYGLIDSGPQVDRARCRSVLAELALHGIVPTSDESAVKALELMAELGVLRG